MTHLPTDLVTIQQARELFPTRPHYYTVDRWIKKGVCGGVRLQSWKVAGRRFTSRKAVQEFIDQTMQMGVRT